ncbi:MAG: LicD family protein [Oscillospiraceae bacterium]|nr:LicD family protein [Oscillospiraceae bacterium]
MPENEKKSTEFVADEDLRYVQMACLEILKKVRDICEQYGLRYYLAYGTLLGAVRHKGFIPWDDDIDIWMPREDHEKFIKLARKAIKPYTINYFSVKNDAFFKFKPLLSIEDHRVKVGFDLDHSEKYGYIWIDIIAMDGMPTDPRKRRQHCKAFQLWYTIIGFARSNRTGVLNMESQSTIRKIGIKLNQITHIGDLLNPDKCIAGFKKCKMKYDFDTAKYVHGSTNAYIEKSVFKKKWFDGERKALYEGEMFSVPMGTEKILTQLYGDYMTPPPPEKRTQLHYHVIK